MSTSVPKIEPIRNLGLVHARWGKYTHPTYGQIPITFHCSSKGLPAFKDAPTWTTSTDDPNEYTGRTITGKSEGIDTLELVIETDPIKVYHTLTACFGKGLQSDLELTYLPRKYYKSRYFAPRGSGEGEGGYGGTFQNVFPNTMFPQYYEEENYDDDEFTIVIPRCVILGLTPAGGENNSASNTTVKFQAEGGPVENLMFLVKTHFFSTAEDDYGYPTVEWDGIGATGKPAGGGPDWMF